MSKANHTLMSTKAAVVDINGTLSTEDYSGPIKHNHELLEVLKQYDRIILLTGMTSMEEAWERIPSSLQYESLNIKPEGYAQEDWKLSYLETLKDPFVLYDDNEILIAEVQSRYGSEYGVLVTNMDGGGYAKD